MRRLGLVLLLAGFGWLLAYQAGVLLRGARPALRGTLVKLDQQPNKSYSKQEVEQLLSEAGAAQYDATPVFALPGALMLIGGLLGATRPRRISSNSAA
jgi:hypothetical protein